MEGDTKKQDNSTQTTEILQRFTKTVDVKGLGRANWTNTQKEGAEIVKGCSREQEPVCSQANRGVLLAFYQRQEWLCTHLEGKASPHPWVLLWHQGEKSAFYHCRAWESSCELGGVVLCWGTGPQGSKSFTDISTKFRALFLGLSLTSQNLQTTSFPFEKPKNLSM